MPDPTRIILWTAPRCISTAFERSIMELKDVKIIHEPYSDAYYLGPERQSNRYTGDALREGATYASIKNHIQSVYNGNEIVFTKDMAYYFDNRHHEIVTHENSETKNTFLIRHPKKAIISLYKSSIDQNKTGWDHFNPNEAGFISLQRLYNEIKHFYGYEPIVIDADDLLSDPAFIMESYCKHTGLTYNNNMLNWKAGIMPEVKYERGWFYDVCNSTGFYKSDSRLKESLFLKMERDYSKMPYIVKQTIEDSMEAYSYLRERRIKLPEL